MRTKLGLWVCIGGGLALMIAAAFVGYESDGMKVAAFVWLCSWTALLSHEF